MCCIDKGQVSKQVGVLRPVNQCGYMRATDKGQTVVEITVFKRGRLILNCLSTAANRSYRFAVAVGVTVLYVCLNLDACLLREDLQICH